jgi:hypothetical protein
MRITHNNQEVNLPDFFVVGAPKCGTTSLFNYLKLSNNIFLPKVKEPHYFAYKDLGKYFKSPDSARELKLRPFITSFQEYKSLFSGTSNNQIIGDFSTHYLRFADSFIENVKEVYGNKARDIKIIIMLRNPVDRAFSHYTMRLRDNSEDLSFIDAINPGTIENRMEDMYLPSYDYIRFSEYAEDIKKLKNTFPNCRIYKFNDFTNDTLGTLTDIVSFLEVQSDINILLNQKFNKSNISGLPKRGFTNDIIFKLVFRRNIIKKLLPSVIKQKSRDYVKSILGKRILDKPKITPQEFDYTKKMLAKEIYIFENFSY